jgi:hypothetical protein
VEDPERLPLCFNRVDGSLTYACRSASRSIFQGPQGIRQVDFAQELDIQSLLRVLPLAGGPTPPAVQGDRIVFGDLTGDGVEEAVVPIFAGSNIGDIAYFVYGYQNG